MTIGNLTLNQSYLELQVSNKTMTLPNKEFQLLFMLAARPKQIFTREQIIEKFGAMIMKEMNEQLTFILSDTPKIKNKCHTYRNSKRTRL